MRTIVVKYSGECRRCGATLSVGDNAIYERHVGLFCLSCEPTDTEEIREYRQEAADRKADKYESWATKRETVAVAQLNSHPEIRHDIAFNTQPGRIPFRDRMNKADERAYESLQTAKRFTDKAASLRHVQVKGDAERKWQARRDCNLAWVQVGMEIETGIYGSGIVSKINKKTVAVRNGTHTLKVDLAFIKRKGFLEREDLL